MNLQTLKKSELLELLTKTEEEQNDWIRDAQLLITMNACCTARLAERLWEKAKYDLTFEIIKLVSVTGKILLESASRFDIFYWLGMESKPIHRIVAALIALRRAGVTEI